MEIWVREVSDCGVGGWGENFEPVYASKMATCL